LPCLYPDSYQNPDDQIKLGRITVWRDDLQGISSGLGQKMLAADDKEFSMSEIREIEFEVEEVEDDGATNE